MFDNMPFMSSGGDIHELISLRLVPEAQLAELDLIEVRRCLSDARRAASKVAGYVARLNRAIEVLEGRSGSTGPGAPSGAESESESESEPEPEPELQSEPSPAPRPSGRQEAAERRRAELLSRYPFVDAALSAGLINPEQADLLIGADLSIQVVAGLLKEAIECADTDHTALLVRKAVAENDQRSAAERLESQKAARAFNWGIDDDGCYWFWLRTDPLTGSRIVERFERADRSEWHGGDKGTARRRAPNASRRSAAQRRADAFLRLLTGTGGSGGGAHLVIDASTLLDLADPKAAARTLFGDQVPAAEWINLLDRRAELFAWVISADGHQLNLGRSGRHADEVQRIALAIRDGKCVWKGCDRHPAACDAHHLREWERFGPTDLANLALLCPLHHHKLHKMGCYLQVGQAVGEWMVIQHHTRREIDRWLNPKRSGSSGQGSTITFPAACPSLR